MILLGLRGAGKSTIGALVAHRLGWPFVDLDPLTAAELRVATPAEALRTLGEPAFRAGEGRALGRALQQRPIVLALGGGTAMFEPAQGMLAAQQRAHHARLIYLHAPPQALRARLARTDLATRPSLTGAGVLDEITELYARRDPVYRRFADEVLDVAGETPEQLALRLTR